MTLPLDPRFNYLLAPDMPRMIREAMKLYGIQEVGGVGDNPTIIGWAGEVGGDVSWYAKDSVPWCGLFMAVVAKRARKKVPKQSLRAKAWASFGAHSFSPSIGDVLVFNRGANPAYGHVGLYVGETDKFFYVLGGNQSDAVTITRIAKSRLHATRHQYRLAPKTAIPHRLGSDFGAVTTNEA